MKIQNMDAAVRYSNQNLSSPSNEGEKTYKSPVRPVCAETRWTTETQKNWMDYRNPKGPKRIFSDEEAPLETLPIFLRSRSEVQNLPSRHC